MVVPKGLLNKSASRAIQKSKMAAIFQDGRRMRLPKMFFLKDMHVLDGFE